MSEKGASMTITFRAPQNDCGSSTPADRGDTGQTLTDRKSLSVSISTTFDGQQIGAATAQGLSTQVQVPFGTPGTLKIGTRCGAQWIVDSPLSVQLESRYYGESVGDVQGIVVEDIPAIWPVADSGASLADCDVSWTVMRRRIDDDEQAADTGCGGAGWLGNIDSNWTRDPNCRMPHAIRYPRFSDDDKAYSFIAVEPGEVYLYANVRCGGAEVRYGPAVLSLLDGAAATRPLSFFNVLLPQPEYMQDPAGPYPRCPPCWWDTTDSGYWGSDSAGVVRSEVGATGYRFVIRTQLIASRAYYTQHYDTYRTAGAVGFEVSGAKTLTFKSTIFRGYWASWAVSPAYLLRAIVVCPLASADSIFAHLTNPPGTTRKTLPPSARNLSTVYTFEELDPLVAYYPASYSAYYGDGVDNDPIFWGAIPDPDGASWEEISISTPGDGDWAVLFLCVNIATNYVGANQAQSWHGWVIKDLVIT